MKVKEESEKVGLKLNIQKTKIMASFPITSWHIEGETMETVRDFNFLGSKITVDGDCSHEIKRHLLLGRKAMTKLDSILKNRHYFSNKGSSSQSSGFSRSYLWMWELNSKVNWALKNWCFELWCWRRLLRVPWTARRSNQSILKAISPEYALEELMLKLKLWPPDAKNWLTRKNPDAGKDWRWEVKGMTEDEMVGWHHQLNGHEFQEALGVGDGQGSLVCCSHGVTKSRTWLSDWTDKLVDKVLLGSLTTLLSSKIVVSAISESSLQPPLMTKPFVEYGHLTAGQGKGKGASVPQVSVHLNLNSYLFSKTSFPWLLLIHSWHLCPANFSSKKPEHHFPFLA